MTIDSKPPNMAKAKTLYSDMFRRTFVSKNKIIVATGIPKHPTKIQPGISRGFSNLTNAQ